MIKTTSNLFIFHFSITMYALILILLIIKIDGFALNRGPPRVPVNKIEGKPLNTGGAVKKQFSSASRPQGKPSSSEKNESDDDNDGLSDITRIADEERLQKVISRAGIASRRAAEKLIMDGRVTVNGNIITELGTKVRTRKDIILVDGQKLNLPDAKSILWVVLNKPRGLLTTMDDDKDRETIHTLIPKAKDLRLLSVGRLDRDTTGVMLLTNENGWIHPLTHPSFVHKRRYEVVVKGVPSSDSLEALKNGVQFSDQAIRVPSVLVNLKDVDRNNGLSLLDMSMEEVIPQQVQRLVEHIQCEVLSIKRLEFGPIKLQGLRKGEWRELTQLEVEKLKASCVRSKTAPPPKSKARGRLFSAKKPGAGYVRRGGGQFETAKEQEGSRPAAGVRKQYSSAPSASAGGGPARPPRRGPQTRGGRNEAAPERRASKY